MILAGTEGYQKRYVAQDETSNGSDSSDNDNSGEEGYIAPDPIAEGKFSDLELHRHIPLVEALHNHV